MFGLKEKAWPEHSTVFGIHRFKASNSAALPFLSFSLSLIPVYENLRSVEGPYFLLFPNFLCMNLGGIRMRLLPDIFILKHESSIFRSFIQPCMWFIHDGTG